AGRGSEGPGGRRDAPDRRPRRRRGAAPVGLQPAEVHYRPVGGERGPDDSLLRPDPGYRHPDQEPDLRAPARPGGGGGGHPAVHVRAQGDPARLRSGDRHLRRPGRGRDACGRSRRGGAPACGAQPQAGRRAARGGGCGGVRRRDCGGRRDRGHGRRHTGGPGEQAMSAGAASLGRRGRSPLDAVSSVVRDNTWTLGLLALLVVLFFFTRFVNPNYDLRSLASTATSVLVLALAAVAQAVVVISGGIDLSVSAQMALTSCVAATLMKANPGEPASYLIVFAVLLLGLLLGAINGSLVVLTRVPDIIVTLATSFVWAGFAL